MNDSIGMNYCAPDANVWAVNLDGRYMSAVQNYLVADGIPTDGVTKIVSNAAQTLSYCPDPEGIGKCQKTGIVIGKVQSGKTSNFISITALAFDNDYDKSVSVGTGFVMGEQGLSTQIDIIIYRNDFPVMFRQSDFVIVVPEAVLGIIEVKSRITGATQLTQVVDKLSVAAEIVCKPIFSGIFSFEGYDGILNRNVNQQVRSTLIRSNGKANHLCIGENCFIKYWPEYAPTRENTRSRYSFYKIDDLAFGYFISNLVEDVYIATVGTNLPETLTSMFYPIENTKEAYKLTEVSMEM